MRQTFVGGVFFPLFFFFFFTPLLSQLPNISFDVSCWDFKRTLSTSAGVGFSEKAKAKERERERVCILGGETWVPHIPS